MSGKYLLDTNIVIALFAGEEAVIEMLKSADAVFSCAIVLGELFYGAQRSGRVKENVEQITEFAKSSIVLGCDAETAIHYGLTKNCLRLKGRPIPENDLWIAAIAKQHKLTLVTRDEHFFDIEGLTVQRW